MSLQYGPVVTGEVRREPGVASPRVKLRWRLPSPGLVRAVALPAAITGWSLHSLALPGYVLQVDAVFGPREPLSLAGFGAPISLIVHLLGGVLAGRLLLGGTLFLCGFGPMFLLRHRVWLAQVPAGLLGALNPWVYDRLVEGQWGVAAACGMVFLWLGAWESLQARPGWRRALASALAAWGAVVLDVHVIGMLLLLAALSLIWHRSWRDPRAALFGLLSFMALGLMLSYALPPFFLGHSNGTYYAVRHFSRADLVEFRSSSSARYGLWVNLLGLYGFWPERLGRIPLLKAGAPWWPISTAVLVALAAAGAVVCRRRAWLLIAGVFGLAVAGSTATALGQAVFLWLMDHLPLVGAYREPQKWSELWLVALVVLSAELISWLADHRQRWGTFELAGPVALLMTLAILLPPGLTALRELPATIVPGRYPSDWTQVAAYMEEHVGGDSPVVVLPWSLYETLPFTGNLLTANPAPVFFPGRLISPNDLQIPGAVTEARSPGDLAAVAINPSLTSCALARTLDRLGVHWALIEPAPGGSTDAAALLGCGFRVLSGGLPGLALMHR